MNLSFEDPFAVSIYSTLLENNFYLPHKLPSPLATPKQNPLVVNVQVDTMLAELDDLWSLLPEKPVTPTVQDCFELFGYTPKEETYETITIPSIPSSSLKAKYKCDYPMCGKEFRKAYNLNSHKNVHSNDKPYNCNCCMQLFKRKHDCKRHLKVVHKRCYVCLLEFEDSDQVAKHVSEFHNVKD